MDVVHIVPHLVRHIVEGFVSQYTRVVDQYVDPPKDTDRSIDNSVTVFYRVIVRNSHSAQRFDFVDNALWVFPVIDNNRCSEFG